MARAGPVAAGRLALLSCPSSVPSRRRFPVLSPERVSSWFRGGVLAPWGGGKGGKGGASCWYFLKATPVGLIDLDPSKVRQ